MTGAGKRCRRIGRPRRCSNAATSSLRLRVSGPPSSTRRGGSGCMASRTTASATSSIATYAARPSPLPKIVTVPRRQSNSRSGASHCSWYASGRTMISCIRESRSRCSVASFASANGVCEARIAPGNEMNTKRFTSASSAALTSFPYPSRSTSRMVTSRRPAMIRSRLCALEITVSIPWIAERRLAASRRSPGTISSARLRRSPGSVPGRTRARNASPCARRRRAIRPPRLPVPPTSRITVASPSRSRRRPSAECSRQRRRPPARPARGTSAPS